MKFLTFTDLHEDKSVLKILLKRISQDDIDFVICAGDISTFGRGLKHALRQFDQIGKKFYVIPGNHESDEMLKEASKGLSNCIIFHKRAFKIENYVFLGYGTDGFSLEDAEFRKIAREWYGKYKGEKIVLVTHGPPFGTKIDLMEKRHVGNKDYRKFIERVTPKLVICGHLHETAGVMDQIGKSKIIHPGWEGMVIELK